MLNLNRLAGAMLLLLFAVPCHLLAQERTVAVIQVSFSDTDFSTDTLTRKKTIERASLYLKDQGMTVSFKDAGTAVLANTLAYYGRNSMFRHDEYLSKALYEACNIAGKTTDFKNFDSDGDGKADLVLLVAAGGNEATGDGEDCIWPQQGSLAETVESFIIGGITVDNYAVVTERCGAGTLCHEYMHFMGMKDLYDTDSEGSGGLSRGMWEYTSIMDRGLYNDGGNTPPFLNAVERIETGLATADTLKTGSYTLRPEDRRILRLDGTTEGQSFLFECRSNGGWDKYIGGSGLLIYRVNRSEADAGWSDYYKSTLKAIDRWNINQVNCNPEFECAQLVCADPEADTVSRVFFPQPGHNIFSSDTNPPFRFHDGSQSGLALTEIRKNSDGSVSFKVIEPLVIVENNVFQDAAILSWTMDSSLDRNMDIKVECCKADDLSEEGTVKYGKGTATIEKLHPKTEYIVTVKIGGLYSASTRFTTKREVDGIPAYINLTMVPFRSDRSAIKGSKIPLRVYNATDAEGVDWYFNGSPISTGDDGYYTLNMSGVLKAVIRYEDGSEDIIVKSLTVR